MAMSTTLALDCLMPFKPVFFVNPKVTKLLERMKGMPRQSDRAAWLKKRKGALTASNVPAVLGHNPYCSRAKIFKKYTSEMEKDEPPNYFMRRGIDMEPIIVGKYCEQWFDTVLVDLPLLTSEKNPWLGASLDGIVMSRRVPEQLQLLEAKYCAGRKSTQVQPFMYWIQCQIQLHVADADLCNYVEYDSKPDNTVFYTEHVIRDDLWFESVFDELKSFWDDVLEWRDEHVRETLME